MNINIETLRKTKGIGSKTLERIIEQHHKDNKIKAFQSQYVPSKIYTTDKDINLWQGDCLELMHHILDKSVDMILCDLPYGTTACSWDEVIPFEPLWSHYKRIIKDNGAIVLFGSEPFSTKLRMSNLDWYKYDWVWDKVTARGHLVAKYRPMQQTEDIMIFGNHCHRMNYYPIMIDRPKNKIKITKTREYGRTNIMGGTKQKLKPKVYDKWHPKNIIKVSNANSSTSSFHPTQKPVPLLEYLIKTYTNEDMLVLDNTMGSGSTGVACRNLNRRFIGIELDTTYFNIAQERINSTERGGK